MITLEGTSGIFGFLKEEERGNLREHRIERVFLTNIITYFLDKK